MNLKMPFLISNDLCILRFKGAMREKKSGEVSFWPARLGPHSPDPDSPDLLLSRSGGEVRRMRVRGMGT